MAAWPTRWSAPLRARARRRGAARRPRGRRGDARRCRARPTPRPTSASRGRRADRPASCRAAQPVAVRRAAGAGRARRAGPQEDSCRALPGYAADPTREVVAGASRTRRRQGQGAGRRGCARPARRSSSAAQDHARPRSGVAFVRDEFRRSAAGSPPERGRGAARRGRQRPAGAGRRLLASWSPTPTGRSTPTRSPATTAAGPRSAASRSPTAASSATCRARWRRCAGRCASASTRCRSPTRSPTACDRGPGGSRRAAATPYQLAGALGHAAVEGREGPAAGPRLERRRAGRRACARSPSCNAAVKGGAADQAYALELRAVVQAARPMAARPASRERRRSTRLHGCTAAPADAASGTSRRGGWRSRLLALADRRDRRRSAAGRRRVVKSTTWSPAAGSRRRRDAGTRRAGARRGGCGGRAGERAVRLAIADLRLAAWLAWMTPLLAALSSWRGGVAQSASRPSRVAGVGGLAELADGRLQRRLDRLVAQPRLLVGLVALDLGLDVRHAAASCFRSGIGRCAASPYGCADARRYQVSTDHASRRPNRCARLPARRVRPAWDDAVPDQPRRPERTVRDQPGATDPARHPQLLHHRPHRPRQVDAGRPDAAAHRGGRRRGRCARSTSTGWTSSASAASRSRRRTSGCRGVGPDGRLRARHDRHPGPRRLHLRGLPVAGRLRGRGAAGRRRAGHRGADAGQPLPGARERPARSSRCSTRSTCRPPSRRSTPRRSRTSSAATRTTCCGSAPRPARASRDLLDVIVPGRPAAGRATRTRRPGR